MVQPTVERCGDKHCHCKEGLLYVAAVFNGAIGGKIKIIRNMLPLNTVSNRATQ